MIPLLLLGLVSLASSSSSPPADNLRGQWKFADENGKNCIMMNAQIDLTLSYVLSDDSTTDVGTPVTVPADSTTEGSSCYEKVEIGDKVIPSQILRLNFPHNEGWFVRLYFTQDPQLEVDVGDWALYQVTVDANYTTMKDLFPDAHSINHTYYSVIDFTEPPEIADYEYTSVGKAIYCPNSPQQFTINSDSHNGPSAFVKLSNVLMQAYMDGATDFGKKDTCPDDQNEVDLVPVIVSAVLAFLVLFTLVAYFVYRSRLPTDILEMTEPEFEEDDDHHHHHHKEEHKDLNHHDNYGYQEEDHRF